MITLGKKDQVVGLSEKAVLLDRAMRAAWSEMVVDADLEAGEIAFEPGALEIISRLFDRAWAQVGQERSPLKTAIMDVLAQGPLSSDEIFAKIKAGPDDGEGTEFPGLRKSEFLRAFREMLQGGILTERRQEMWSLE